MDRTKGERGFCRALDKAEVDGEGPHFGEEDVLVGRYGSGTVFFAHCVMACVFCQNCEISQGEGEPLTTEELAEVMLELQERGCHNLNLVSPTHYIAQIIEALCLAIPQGLRLPLVYNTGGYEHLETLRLLDGVVDIYMPDLKFMDAKVAQRLAKAPDYPQITKMAIGEMHRQVGDLKTHKGVAYRGLILRHLVLPGDLASTEAAMEFVAQLSPHTYVNLMSQYYPAFKAPGLPPLDRRVSSAEMEAARRACEKAGLLHVH